MSTPAQASSTPVSGSLRASLPRALVILTAATGVIDAVSYLGLGRVFSANMTGNVVLLGFGVAGTGGLPVVSPLIAAIAFLAGAGAGGLLASRATRPLRLALAIEIALIVVTCALAAALDVQPNHASGDALVALLALAMGVRNSTVRKLGVPDLTTTVLTMTLTGLAADSPAAGGTGKGTARRVAAVAAMFAGALVGALLVEHSLVAPLLLAAALALVAWFIADGRLAGHRDHGTR
jgi:uncharacterized membrane protein YoaK (UPF0700 family)